MALEEYYSGDNNWKDFVSIHSKNPMSGEQYVGNENRFSSIGNLNSEGVQLLIVAVSLFGLEQSINWLNKKIPALEYETPFDCITASQTSDAMKKRIREYLMRVPV